MRTVAFVAACDSQFKWATYIAPVFKNNGWETSYVSFGHLFEMSAEQLSDLNLNIDMVNIIHGNAQICSHLANFDAVFLLLPGGHNEKLIYSIKKYMSCFPHYRCPVIITGYVGMAIKDKIAGFLYRVGADLFCVNSRSDLACFQEVCKELDISAERLVLSGLPLLPPAKKGKEQTEIKTIVFADQVAIPSSHKERVILYNEIVNYALAHPEREVIIKPRHRANETSFHKGPLLPEFFFNDFEHITNLKIDYTPIQNLLATADLLVTVSSTAALEAICLGVKVAILADFLVRESDGNTAFVGSNLIRTWDQISNDEIGEVDPLWIHNNFDCCNIPSETIYQRVQDAVSQRKKTIGPAPKMSNFEQTRVKLVLNAARGKKKKKKNDPTLIKFIKLVSPPILVSTIYKIYKLTKKRRKES